jgi:branched-chain amino acid transport system substrate-binding protein
VTRVIRRRLLLTAASAAVATAAVPGAAKAAARLVIGQSLPLTGPLASYGRAKLAGSRAYFAGVNQDNSDHHIEVVTLDDRYDPALTVENTQLLADKHHASALLGYFGVPTVNAALPLFDQLKIPIVGLTSGSRDIRKQHRPYVFPVRASYRVELEKIVSHMKTVGFKRVTVIAQKNAYGGEVSDTFFEVAGAIGIKDISMLQLSNDSQNVAAVVDGIASNSQAVLLATLSGQAVATVKLMKDKKILKQIYGLSALDATHLYQSLGSSASGIVQSQVVPSPNDNTKAICRRYAAMLKKSQPDEAPSYFGLEGFIEAMVLHEGIRRTRGATTGSQGRLALKASLEQLGSLDIGGFVSDYSPKQRTGSRYVDLTILGTSGRTVR